MLKMYLHTENELTILQVGALQTDRHWQMRLKTLQRRLHGWSQQRDARASRVAYNQGRTYCFTLFCPSKVCLLQCAFTLRLFLLSGSLTAASFLKMHRKARFCTFKILDDTTKLHGGVGNLLLQCTQPASAYGRYDDLLLPSAPRKSSTTLKAADISYFLQARQQTHGHTAYATQILKSLLNDDFSRWRPYATNSVCWLVSDIFTESVEAVWAAQHRNVCQRSRTCSACVQQLPQRPWTPPEL